MADIAKRFAENPILRPADIRPSIEGMKVECLLNPGVFRFNDQTWLLLRVAERPKQKSGKTSFPILGAKGELRILVFDNSDPKLDRAGYVERVKHIVARPARDAALPLDDRIVIPGYTNLREFSRDEESAVKEGLGGPFWTWLHWTNWRVVLPVDGSHQEGVAHEILHELRAGRLVQLLVTNWPKPELNHTVVAFESRPTANGVEFLVWDPNNPDGPGIMTWDSGARRFWATDLYDTEPGPIRAFRMYHSLLL